MATAKGWVGVRVKGAVLSWYIIYVFGMGLFVVHCYCEGLRFCFFIGNSFFFKE